MRSLVLTLVLVATAVVSVTGVLSFVEQRVWPSAAQASTQANSQLFAVAAPRPKMRVGLYKSDEPITLTVAAPTRVVTGDAHNRLVTIPSNEVITLSYDRSTAAYTIRSDSFSTTTTDYIKIKPTVAPTVTTITSYINTPVWDDTINDNQFLGAIELRYAETTDAVWVINELGIENYVKGVAEAGDDNTAAYLKTLYTAARSYAYYHYLYPTKHAGEHYILDTTANDQVFRGYGFTARAPHIVAAVDATAGTIVHYDGEPVVTPYFSQSDGRTRAWSEVWSGEYPYLLTVADPGCAGDELFGHGVGLSAKGARYFSEQSWHWREILHYYYQGTELRQLW